LHLTATFLDISDGENISSQIGGQIVAAIAT